MCVYISLSIELGAATRRWPGWCCGSWHEVHLGACWTTRCVRATGTWLRACRGSGCRLWAWVGCDRAGNACLVRLHVGADPAAACRRSELHVCMVLLKCLLCSSAGKMTGQQVHGCCVLHCLPGSPAPDPSCDRPGALQGGLELILSVDGTAAQYLVPQELVSLAEAVKASDLQRCTSLSIGFLSLLAAAACPGKVTVRLAARIRQENRNQETCAACLVASCMLYSRRYA